MNNDDFYEKKQMADSVDKLMNDMTVMTIDRRSKDAERLSLIREKQLLKSTAAKRSNPLKKMRAAFSKKKSKNERNLDFGEKITESPHNPPVLSLPDSRKEEYSYYGTDDDWDDKTVIIDECGDDETVLLEEDGDETVLMDAYAVHHKQAVLMVGEKEYVTELKDCELRIGSQADGNDIVLDSKYVSRYHLKIIFEENDIYIVDLGSKNGTFLEGNKQPISKNTEYRINYGSKVRLADTEIEICRCEEIK